MHLQNSKEKMCKIPRGRLGLIMILLGVTLVSACLLSLVRPLYTFAANVDEYDDRRCRITVSPDSLFELGNLNPGDAFIRTLTVTNEGELPSYIWLKHEWVDGDPLRGEVGDLFSQLNMTISWRNVDLYSGPMNGLVEPLDISVQIGPVRPAETMELDFYIWLPGPETGNEFQGATVTTRVILLAICGSEEDVPPDPPGTDPPEPPGPPDLPRTEGLALTLVTLIGFALILLGLIVRKGVAKEGRP